MSLTEISFVEVVRKQHAFKLKSYGGVFTSLVMIQFIALLFSFGASGGMGSSSGSISYEISYYSGWIIISFTYLWAFITAILITTKAYRNDDFTFVSNRLTSNLSNIFFLLTASLIGGVTALLASNVIKLLVVLFYDLDYVIGASLTIQDFFIGLLSTTLYIFMFTAAGYLVGTLVQLHKLFVIIIPAVFIGGLFVDVGQFQLISHISEFYVTEASFLLFVIKSVITVVLLFLTSIVLSNRLEVKQ